MSDKGHRGNKKLSNLYYGRVMNNAEIDVIPQIMNEDFVFTIPTHPEVFKGTKGFEEEVTGLHGAFPDVHLDVHHKWCFDDLILGLWTGTGTHIGDKPLSTPKGPLPATGNSFVIQGVSWISADGVLLRENLANEDTLKIIHDLGVKDCTKIYSNAAASLASARQFPTQSTKKTTAQSQFAINFKFNHPLLLQEGESESQYENFMATYWNAFESVEMNITESKREGVVNAYRWTFEADHVRPFFGIPATHKRIRHQGVTVWINNSQGSAEKVYFNENLIVLMGQMES
tara:strand:- start:44 stop:904 length:861 start_codon:yes stop_codon:yes gene_type:complete